MESTVVSQSDSEPTIGHTSNKPVVSVVTATYNEEQNLPILLEELFNVFESEALAAYHPFEIVIANDPGEDRTQEVIREWADRRPEVRGIFQRRRFGQSAGLKAGIDHSRGEIVVTMDADLQNDPADIPALLREMEDGGYDCVSGWRKDRHDSIGKRIPSAIQTPLAKLTGPDINDFGCTLKAYKGQAIRDIDLYGEGHRYIPARLYKLGYSIGEIEVNHRPRVHGESRYGIGRLLRGFQDLVFHLFWTKYSTRPGHLLGVLGLVLFGFGMAVGGHAAAMRLFFGDTVMEHLPRLLATVGLVIVGVQLMGFAILAELWAKSYYKRESTYRVSEYVGFD